MRNYSKYLIICAAVSCGSAPSVTERIIDVSPDVVGQLLAEKPKDDLPLSYCAQNKCYTYTEEDAAKIKKYIVTLETRLRQCQKNCRCENVQ